MSAFQKAMFTSKLPPRTNLQANRRLGRNRLQINEDYSPTQWNTHFTDRQDVKVGSDSFRVYTIGDDGPLLVLLHGGGFSALTWCLFSKKLMDVTVCRILAIDLRGHGDTNTSDDTDLSIERLTSDVINILNKLYGDSPPGIVLIGHSMGGAVAVHVANSEQLPTLLGLVVIDVVEGTAISALASMQSFLRSRPKGFQSIEDAIRWSLQSGQLKNIESAKVSMPGQLKNSTTGKSATSELDNYSAAGVTSKTVDGKCNAEDSIQEDEETTFKVPGQKEEGKYTWRIDLRKTEPYWSGWFQGLSKKFLSSHGGKLLLLANLDRLDTDLTIGQMQGKFEMHAFESNLSRCGHAVHEDLPQDVATVVAAFLIRNKFATCKDPNFRPVMPTC